MVDVLAVVVVGFAVVLDVLALVEVVAEDWVEDDCLIVVVVVVVVVCANLEGPPE